MPHFIASCGRAYTLHKQVTNVSQHVFVILLWWIWRLPFKDIIQLLIRVIPTLHWTSDGLSYTCHTPPPNQRAWHGIPVTTMHSTALLTQTAYSTGPRFPFHICKEGSGILKFKLFYMVLLLSSSSLTESVTMISVLFYWQWTLSIQH